VIKIRDFIKLLFLSDVWEGSVEWDPVTCQQVEPVDFEQLVHFGQLEWRQHHWGTVFAFFGARGKHVHV
jgi:hypothetical protein